MIASTDLAILLGDLNGHLSQLRWVMMGVLDQNHYWQEMTWFESVRSVGNDFGFAFSKQAKKIWEPIMRFRVKQDGG